MNRRYTKKRRSLKKRSLTKKKRKNTFRKQRGGIGGTTQRKAAEAKAAKEEEVKKREELDRQVEAAANLQSETVKRVLRAKNYEEELREERARLAEVDALSEGDEQKVRQEISAAIKTYMSVSEFDNETDVPDEIMLEIIKKILIDKYPAKTDAELDVDSNKRLLLRKMRNFKPSTTQKVYKTN